MLEGQPLFRFTCKIETIFSIRLSFYMKNSNLVSLCYRFIRKSSTDCDGVKEWRAGRLQRSVRGQPYALPVRRTRPMARHVQSGQPFAHHLGAMSLRPAHCHVNSMQCRRWLGSNSSRPFPIPQDAIVSRSGTLLRHLPGIKPGRRFIAVVQFRCGEECVDEWMVWLMVQKPSDTVRRP